jgi:hypothetical protein
MHQHFPEVLAGQISVMMQISIKFSSQVGCSQISLKKLQGAKSGNTIGGSITVPLTSCLTGLESAV